MALLDVKDLSISFVNRGVTQQAVKNLSFSVLQGETLGIVGESGSGKSVSCYALLGLIPSPPGYIESGSAWFDGQDLLCSSEAQLRQIRGDQIAMVFQDPMTCLNPFLSIGEQIIEALRQHSEVTRGVARERALALLSEVGIAEPERNISKYPFEFSGGMRQRVMIAMALISEPKLLIADEPTTALDVTIQAQVLSLLAELKAKRNFSVIFISHDLAIVRQLADKVLVMQNGEMVEQGTSHAVFSSPQRAYTKALLAAVPKGAKVTPGVHHGNDSVERQQRSTALLVVDDLAAGYQVRESGKSTFKQIVEGISFQIQRGEIVGLVGESGSGKSTIGRTIVKLLPTSAGRIYFDEQRLDTLSQAEMRPLRTRIQMIFQDPYASLNPRMTVFEALAEPLLFYGLAGKHNVAAKVSELMLDVGLAPDLARKYPHEFSGGQRQRIAIGRALACRPDLIIADEPVSALDVTVQSQILDLLLRLVAKYTLSMLFISHDLGVIRVLCDRVLVLQNGRMVEQKSTEELWSNPQHPYTKTLLAAAPVSE